MVMHDLIVLVRTVVQATVRTTWRSVKHGRRVKLSSMTELVIPLRAVKKFNRSPQRVSKEVR